MKRQRRASLCENVWAFVVVGQCPGTAVAAVKDERWLREYTMRATRDVSQPTEHFT